MVLTANAYELFRFSWLSFTSVTLAYTVCNYRPKSFKCLSKVSAVALLDYFKTVFADVESSLDSSFACQHPQHWHKWSFAWWTSCSQNTCILCRQKIVYMNECSLFLFPICCWLFYTKEWQSGVREKKQYHVTSVASHTWQIADYLRKQSRICPKFLCTCKAFLKY